MPLASKEDWTPVGMTRPANVQPNEWTPVANIAAPTVAPQASDWAPVAVAPDPASVNELQRDVVNPFMRGLTDLNQAVDTGRMAVGITSPEQFAQATLANDRAKLAYPQHPDDAKFMSDLSKLEGWDQVGAVLQNPRLWAQTAIGSLPASAPSLLGGAAGSLAGPVGAGAGMGAASALTEFNSSLLDAIREASPDGGVTEDSLVQAISDPNIMARAREYAVKRGISVGVFDAISGSLAGRLMHGVESKIGEGVVGKVVGGAAELGLQAGTGMAGETAAQLTSRGKITSPSDIVLEGVAEIPGAITEPLTNKLSGVLPNRTNPADELPTIQPKAPTFDTGVAAANTQTVDPSTLTPSEWSAVGTVTGGAPAFKPTVAPVQKPAEPVQAPEPVQPVQPMTPPVQAHAPVVTQAEPPKPSVTIPNRPGTGTEKVTTPDKSFETDTTFEVVDADQLKSAEGEDQPRDRANRGASAGQIAQIAANLDPLDLLSSRNSDSGAPIIDENNTILSGNGRTAAIIRAAENHPERYAAYRATLEGLGYNTAGMKTPVLVRRATGIPAEKRRLFTTRSNVSANQSFSAPERARVDQGYVTPDMLAGYDPEVENGVSAASNRAFAMQFIRNMPPAEHNAMLTTDGQLSTEGASRIENAIFAKAYGDKALIDKATETNADPGLRNALLGAAAAWANMREKAPAFDVTPDLVAALGLLNDARGKGMTLDGFLSQVDAFRDAPSERVQNLARLMLNKDGSRLAAWKDIRDRLRSLANDGAKSGAAEGDLLGDRPNVDQTIKNLLQGVSKSTDKTAPVSGTAEPSAPNKSPESEPNMFGGETLATKPLSGKAPPPSEGLFGQPSRAASSKKIAAKPSMEDSRAPAEPSPPEDLGDDRRPRGTLAPQTEDVSMTRRRSIFEEAFRAAGYEPDEGVLLPAVKQAEVLSKLLRQTFGFASVNVTKGADIKDAVNQMLDAYRNVRFMLHALALPLEGISLDGSLSLTLERDRGLYFGVYRPATKEIGLPGRSNSFAHEWAHALDHYLGDALQNADALLSHITRGKGLDPNVSIENAFINLIHTMFFDEAGLAAKALQLEQDAAATIKNGPNAGQPTQKAIAAQAELDRLYSGATRIRLPDSEYRARSKQYDPGNPYWASVHEMLARAFEAYVAARVEAAGGSNEFITKGEAAYLSDADRRLDLTFPKGLNREAIFAAFDDVFHHLRNQAILGSGPAAPKPVDTDIIDPQHWNKIVLSQGQPNILQAMKQEAFAVRNAAKHALDVGPKQALKEGVSAMALNAGINTQTTFGQVARAALDTTRHFFFTLRGAVRPRIARNKGKGASFLEEAMSKVMSVNGTGGYQAATFEDDRQHEAMKAIAGMESALRSLGFDKLRLTKDENNTVRELLFGKSAAGADKRLVQLAAAFRRTMDEAHANMKAAGISLGYVRDKGYLPRVLNPSKVQTDPAKFQRDASALYRRIFDDITPDMSERDVLALSQEINTRMGANLSRFATEQAALAKAIKAFDRAVLRHEEGIARKAKLAELNQLAADVKTAKADMKAARQDLLDVIREPYGEASADDWLTRIQIGDSFTYDSHGPATNFTKNRTLPGYADDMIADWYNTDVVNLVASYVHQAQSRVAFVERMGNPSGDYRLSDLLRRPDVLNRMNANAATRRKYEAGKDIKDMSEAARLAIIKDFANTKTDNIVEMLFREAERSGAWADDVKYVRSAIETITGRRQDRGPFTDYLQRFSGLVYTYTYLRLLPRAAITSLTEPVGVLLRTGNADAMFKTFAAYLGELNQAAKSTEERAAIARAIGLTSSPLYDTILMSRMGMDHGHITSGNVLLAGFFKANFLSAVTNAQRRSVMAGGFHWMQDMAKTFAHPKTDKVRQEMIRAEFRELGIPDADMQSFLDWLTQSKEMPSLSALDSKPGHMFQTAIHRLTSQIIQDPRRADKPAPASTPFGRVIYSLTAYLYSFFSNVHAATVTRAVRNYKIGVDNGLSKTGALVNAGLPAATSFVGGFATLFVGQLLISLVRESLFNGEQWDKHRKDGDLYEWLTALSGSRTGIAGPADILLNAVTGLKYERDLANLMVGPGFSSIFSDVQNVMGLITTNSPKTNTAERNAAKAIYRLLVAPIVSTALVASGDSGPVGAALKYGLMTAATSNGAASKFADMVAGPQTKKKNQN